MAVTDIASRTYNHGWRLDPIVRSLLDTDFYKLLMLQMIRDLYPDQRVTFSVINCLSTTSENALRTRTSSNGFRVVLNRKK